MGIGIPLNCIVLNLLLLLMVQRTTEYFSLRFYSNYVIAEAHESTVVNSFVARGTLKIIFEFYKGRDFVLISNRKNNYTVEMDSYSPKLMKKIRGMAVVSQNPFVKEKASVEQLQFDQSFAFFENLEDARGWADSFVMRKPALF